MQRMKVLLLSLLLTSSVHSVRVFGDYTSEDPMRKLDNLKAEKLHLERAIAITGPGERRNYLQMKLKNVDYWIRKIEDTSKVLYKDYLQMMAENKAELEKEKADRKKHLEKQKELTKEKDQLAKEYAEYIETHNEHQEMLTKEKYQIIRERDEVMQKLREAQNLHSQALEAIAVTTQEGYELVSIPHQNDINILRDKVTALISENNEDQHIDDLLITQTSLKDLLHTLNEEGEFSKETNYKDLEAQLAITEMRSMQTRDEHDTRRKVILQSMKNKELGDYTKEEIMSLQQANQGVVETRKKLQQIARQSAYLKAISQVNFLMRECTTAIKYAKQKAMLKGRRGTVLTNGNGLQDMVSLDSARDQDINRKALARLPSTQNPPDGQGNELVSYEEAQSMHNMIQQKALLYKDLLELYRTKLSTEIMNGLAKINKRLPIPFPGCSITRLIDLRNALNKWVERVQYATRLSKQLHKYDNTSIVLRYFLKSLENLRNAFVTLVGKNVNRKTDLQEDDEISSSVEKFDEEIGDDYSKYYQYVKVNLEHLLDTNAELSGEQLREFRYNFIFVRKYPDVLVEASQRILGEKRDSPTGEIKQLEEFGQVSEEMEISRERLSQLFNVLISRVKSIIEEQYRAYQAAFKEHLECRHALVTSLPLFRNMNWKKM